MDKLDWGVLSDLARIRSKWRRWAEGRPRRVGRRVNHASLCNAEGRFRCPVVWAQHWAGIAVELYPDSEILSLTDTLTAVGQAATAVTMLPSTGKRQGPQDTSPRKKTKVATREPGDWRSSRRGLTYGDTD